MYSRGLQCFLNGRIGLVDESASDAFDLFFHAIYLLLGGASWASALCSSCCTRA